MSGRGRRNDDGVDSDCSDQLFGAREGGRAWSDDCATLGVDVGNRSELGALDPRKRWNPAALRDAAAPHQSDLEDRQRVL